ncbi:MAG: hypothetical protein ACODAB_10430 [Gemmatimonadota bacterium]
MIRDEDIPEERPGTTDRTDDTGELVGRGVGGLGGAVVGGAAGAVGGPVGVIIGGIAGAAGGWWAGDRVARVVAEMSARDQAEFREHYESTEPGVPRYEDARVGYIVGSVASRHPEYEDRDFEEVEADLQQGFVVPDAEWDFTYDELRPYIREGYTRARSP